MEIPNFLSYYICISLDDEIASLAAEAERKRPEDRTEAEKVAILGKPRLGEITRAQIRIKESKEFKVRCLCRLAISFMFFYSVIRVKM